MSSPKYPRGSEWRRWDLHFHTPSSWDYRNNRVTDKRIIEVLKGNDVAAVAITDHHKIDIDRIRSLRMLAGIEITVFPAIELRSELGGTESVHFIGIFSEQCNLEELRDKLVGKLDLTDADIARKGNDKIYCDFLDTAKLIHELGGIVSVHAGGKSNSLERIANTPHFKQKIKEDLAKEAIDLFELGDVADIDVYRKIVFPDIRQVFPLVMCSDNHDIEKYSSKEVLWIKADPTFLGLQQVLIEPEDRAFLGITPTSVERRENASTRIIDSVDIRKSANATTSEKWFDASLPINQELVAIIGNKGSGKSALADVLGLLGNTPRFKSFSFLNEHRFRTPKDNKARHFDASLTWADKNVEGPISLDKDPVPQGVEKIRYIPQNYLEDICNEITLGKGSSFYSELQQVIFSHVPEAERQGYSSLDDLLEYRSEETQRAIDLLIIELGNLNKEIIGVEEQLTLQFRQALESQLNEKQRELESHDKSKPKEIPKPEEDPSAKEESKQISSELTKKQEVLKLLENQIAGHRTEDARLIRQQSMAEKLLQRIQNVERLVKKTIDESRDDFQEFGLKQEEILSYSINTVPISNRISSIEQERKRISDLLDGKRSGSVEKQRLDTAKEIDQLQTKLSAPQRNYQNYLRQLAQWQTKREGIGGHDQLVGSIKYLEKQIADLAGLPKKLSTLQSRRNRKTLEIYREKQKLRDYYSSYYGAVQVFLGEHPIAKTEGFKLTFNVSIVQEGFSERFLQYVHQRKFGPFAGLETGSGELQRLLDSTNFDSPFGILRFTRRLFEIMTMHEGKRIEVRDQLLQSASLTDIYDFVFSLGYLSPIYNLRWDKRALEQLSPGERGNLLLIFYLLVDRDDIPLVIDQPEENLDNQTVYKTLVPCIKDAKKRRQIIMVTHNPNLAVVCDAEQVIYAEIQKDQGNKVTYINGSIEDPTINKKVIDVLEGTRPAFDKRDAKYSLVP